VIECVLNINDGEHFVGTLMNFWHTAADFVHLSDCRNKYNSLHFRELSSLCLQEKVGIGQMGLQPW
jgi:hypothetical protein